MDELPGAAWDQAVLLFGPFVLSVPRRELRLGAHPVALGARAFELLLLLVQRAGEVVGKREIAERLWPDDALELSRLRAHVAALRRALREGEAGSRYIVNVLGRGYVFVAAVRRVAAPALPVAQGGPRLDPRAPPAPEPIVGREEALVLLAGLVRTRRLVTVVGAGGLGKSATALALVARLAPEFADGVGYVDLAGVDDPARLADAVAAALGLTAPLCVALAGRHLLLVLDNCGHLADATALLAEALLAASARVHLLATSREALALQDESVHRLAPLAFAPALRLFALHGVREAAGAACLCRRLEGNPLALMLAAARVREVGIGAFGAGLAPLFAPAAGAPGASDPRDPHDPRDPGASRPARHRSLEAMLDWSWRLLATREQTVLRRLAVFSDAFTLERAGAVLGAIDVYGDLDAGAVAESVLALRDRSLVEVADGDPAGHYRLTALTREFARRRLDAAGETQMLARRHADCMLALYRRADADLQRLGARAFRLRYEGTQADFAAALDWALGPEGDPALGIALTAQSWLVMIEIGRIEDHKARVARALAALARLPQPQAALEAPLLGSLALMSSISHVPRAQAEAYVARLDGLARAAAEPQEALRALHGVAGWTMGMADYPAGLRLAERIVPLALRSGEPLALAMAYRYRAQALHYLGLHAEAARTASAVLEGALPQRNVHYLGPAPRAVAMVALLARIAWIEGRPDAAAALADEAVRIAEGEHPFALGQALAVAAIPVAWWSGDQARADALCERLAASIDHGTAGYFRPWLQALRWLRQAGSGGAATALAAPPQPLPTPLIDLLGTLDVRLAGGECLRRVRKGAVGWNAPEILRARGQRLLDAGAPPHAVERIWLAAQSRARRQRAAGWERRIAASLARLAAGR